MKGNLDMNKVRFEVNDRIGIVEMTSDELIKEIEEWGHALGGEKMPFLFNGMPYQYIETEETEDGKKKVRFFVAVMHYVKNLIGPVYGVPEKRIYSDWIMADNLVGYDCVLIYEGKKYITNCRRIVTK